MNGEPGDDLSHDAHLRAALRHAPDHALAPPASLSQNILAAARQAHRPARAIAAPPPPVRVTVPPPRPISMLLRWLASPRSAGALATALVASLGIGLWLDIGNEPVVERPGVETLGAKADAPTTVVAAAPVSAAPATDPAAATRPVTPTAAPTVAPATATADSAAQQARTAQTGAARAEAPKVARERAAAAAPDTAAEAARVANEAPRPARDDRPPAPAPYSEPARGEPAAPALAKAEPSDRRALATAPPAATPAARAKSEGAAAPAPAQADAAPAGRIGQLHSREADTPGIPAPSPALTLLRLARSELAAGSAQWEWQGPDAARAPLDDAGQAWLQRVVQGARGRWVEASGAHGAETPDAAAVPLARWWRDGVLHATLRFEADGLRWVEAGGRVRFAPLDAAASQQLRER